MRAGRMRGSIGHFFFSLSRRRRPLERRTKARLLIKIDLRKARHRSRSGAPLLSDTGRLRREQRSLAKLGACGGPRGPREGGKEGGRGWSQRE